MNTCHSWRRVVRASSPAGSVGQGLRGMLIHTLDRSCGQSHAQRFLAMGFHLLPCLRLFDGGCLPFLSFHHLEITA